MIHPIGAKWFGELLSQILESLGFSDWEAGLPPTLIPYGVRPSQKSDLILLHVKYQIHLLVSYSFSY